MFADQLVKVPGREPKQDQVARGSYREAARRASQQTLLAKRIAPTEHPDRYLFAGSIRAADPSSAGVDHVERIGFVASAHDRVAEGVMHQSEVLAEPQIGR